MGCHKANEVDLEVTGQEEHLTQFIFASMHGVVKDELAKKMSRHAH